MANGMVNRVETVKSLHKMKCGEVSGIGWDCRRVSQDRVCQCC